MELAAGSTGVTRSWPGSPVDGRVEEDHLPGAADRFHQLGSELLNRENLDLGIVERLAQPLGGVPAEAVVAAKRVAVADDQDAGHQRAPIAGACR